MQRGFSSLIPSIVTTILVVVVVVTVDVDAASIGMTDNNNKATDLCDSQIYCEGDLLKTVQLSGIYEDSKTFVDMSQLNEPEVTLANFRELMIKTNNQPTREEIRRYVNENFVSSGELENHTLSDWQENPPILKRITDEKYRVWAKNLNDIWKTLARKISQDVKNNPDKHSLIYVNNPFIIPGGRFKEFYYWDSYWVIEGLLLCGMTETPKGIIDNFMSLVERFNFIPNGGRIYYLMRSQLPLLIPMVDLYLQHTSDENYLSANIGTLVKEFDFWMKEKMVDVRKNGKTYTMARYIVNSPRPRPESYREDYRLAEKLGDEESRAYLFNNLKAAAETGWDFSARWFRRRDNGEQSTLIDIDTENIIPVELNSVLQKNAYLLSKYHTWLKQPERAEYYTSIAANLQDAIDNVLWNEKSGTWFDYDIRNGQPRSSFYPTNLAPLYTLSYNFSKRRNIALKSIRYLKEENIEVYFGGTPTSLNQTGEQWDFPNAWPPLQSFLIQGLYKTGVKEAKNLADVLATRWLRANYEGYQETGKMFEKYDAVFPGKQGGGGEYIVQQGFGWTNGVVYELLNTFPNAKSSDSVRDIEDDSSSSLQNSNEVYRVTTSTRGI